MEVNTFYQKGKEVQTQLCYWQMLSSDKLPVGELIDEIDDELGEIVNLYTTEWNMELDNLDYTIQINQYTDVTDVISYISEYILYLKRTASTLTDSELYIKNEIHDIIEEAVKSIKNLRLLIK